MSDQSMYEQIAKISLDVRDFAKAANEVMSTIEYLKSSLNFKKSAEGLNDISKSFDQMRPSIDNTDKSILNLKQSFSDFIKSIGKIYVAKKAMDALDAASKSMAKTIKAMSGVEQFRAGWNKYTEKVQSVQTIMAATGKTIDEVNAALERLNWYSDETSYSFTDMTSNIAKFTSAGIELNDAVAAMEGISNWAATSGQSTQAASRVMYNMSQAIGSGKMLAVDWRSIENANMATKEFKEMAIQAAVSIGTLKKVGDDYYTSIGKKQKVTVNDFRDTLTSGWFNTEVMMKTLKNYSEFTDKVYDYIQQYAKEHPEEGFITVSEAIEKMGKEVDKLGLKWFKSAQEAKTWTDVVNATKDAVSTGWMNTFELIFGNYEEVRTLWSDLAEEFYEIFATPLQNQNLFLYNTMTGSYKKLVKEMNAANLSVDEFQTTVLDYIKTNAEWKAELDGLLETYGDFTGVLNSGEFKSEWIFGAFTDPSITGNAKKTTKTLEEVQQIVEDTFKGKYGSGQERIDAYKKLGLDPEALQKLVNNYSHTGKVELKDLETVGIEAGKSYSETWQEFINGNKDLINSIDELSGRQLLLASFWNVFSNVKTVFSSIKGGLASFFNVTPEGFKRTLENVYKFTEFFKISEEGAEKLRNSVTALAQPFVSIFNIGKRFISSIIGNSIEKRIPIYLDKIKNFGDSVYTTLRRTAKVFKSLEESTYVNNLITKYSKGIRAYFAETRKNIKESVSEYEKAFADFWENSFVGREAKKAKDLWNKIWKETNTGGKNAFDTLVQTYKKFKTEWSKEHEKDANPIEFLIKDLKNGYDRLVEILKTVDILKPIFTFWNGFKEKYDTLKNGFLESSFVKSIEDFKTQIKTKLENLKKDFESSTFGKIFTLIGKALFNHFKDLINPAKHGIRFSITNGKNGGSGKTGIFDWVLQNVRDSLTNLKNELAKTKIGTQITNIIEYAKKQWNSIFAKENSSSKNNEKTNGAKLAFGGKAEGKNGKSVSAQMGIEKKNAADVVEDGIKKSIINENAMYYLNRISELFDNLKTRVTDKVTEIRDKISNLWESYKQTGMYKALSDLWNWARPLMKTFAEKLVNTFTYKDASSFFMSLAAFNASLAGKGLAKNIGNFVETVRKEFKEIKPLQSLLGSIQTVPSAISRYLTGKDGLMTVNDSIKTFGISFAESIKPFTASIQSASTELKARSFLEIAAGIGIIAGALYLLHKAEIQLSDMKDPAIIIGGIGAAIAGLVIAVNKLGSGGADFSFGKVIVMVFALTVIADAVHKLSESMKTLDGTTLNDWPALVSVIVLMFSSLGAVYAFRKTEVLSALPLIFTLLSVALAVNMLVKAVSQLRGYDWREMLVSVGGVAALILSLAGAMAIIGLTGGPLWIGSALSILAMAGAVRILVQAILQLTVIRDVQGTQWADAISAIIGLIWSLGGAVGLSGLGIANILGGTALSIIAMASAIRIMVGAVKEFSGIPKEDLEKSTKAITDLLGSLSTSVFKVGWSFANLGKAATVFAFVGAIYALQNAVKTLGKMSGIDISKSVYAITELLDSLSSAVFKSGWTLNGLGGALSSLGIAKAIQWIVDAVKVLADPSIDLTRLSNAVEIVKGLIGYMTTMEALLGIVNRFKAGISLTQVLGLVGYSYAIGQVAKAVSTIAQINQDRLAAASGVVFGITIFMGVLIGLLGRMDTSKVSAIGGLGMLTGFAIAVKTISAAVKDLSDIDPDALKHGGRAVAQIIVALMAVVPLISHFKVPNIKALGLSFLGFSIGLAIIGSSIEKLGEMNRNKLIRGGGIMTVLMLLMGSVAWFVSKASEVSSFEGAATIAAIAASVYIVAMAFKNIAEVPEKDIKKAGLTMAALVVAVGVLGRLCKIQEANIRSAISLTILAAAASGIALVAKTFADMDWSQLGRVGAAMVGMIGAMWGISKFVQIGSTSISIGAVAKLGAVIVEIGGILTIIGALYSIPGVDDAVHSGGDFLMELGRALGGFFGAIIGGFQEGVTRSMPAIGTAMAGFAENARPFFEMLDAFQNIDPIGSIMKLSQALESTVWSDFLARITKAFATKEGENGETVEYFRSLEAFGNSLAMLAPNMQTFIDAFKGIPDEDLGHVEKVVGFISTLGGLTKEKQKVSLVDFSADIKSATTNIQEGITAWNDIPTPNDNVQQIVNFLSSVAAIDVKPSDGVYTWYKDYSKAFTEFAADLAGSVTTVEQTNEKGEIVKTSLTFADAVAGWNKIPTPNGNAKAIIQFVKDILEIKPPASGGFIGDVWKSYEKAFTEFASDIAAAVPNLSRFMRDASTIEGYDMDKVNNVLHVIEAMATTTQEYSPANYIGGFESYTTMVGEFIAANGELKSLAADIDESGITKIEEFLSFLDGSKTIDTTFIDAVPQKIEGFVSSLKGLTIDENLTKGLEAIINSLSFKDEGTKLEFETIAEGIASGMTYFTDITSEDIRKAQDSVTAISNFVFRSFKIQENFKPEELEGNLKKMVQIFNEVFATLHDPGLKVTSFYKFFESLYNVMSIDFEVGEGNNNKLAVAFRSLGDAVKAFKPDEDTVLRITNFREWLDGLDTKNNEGPDFSGWEDAFGQVAGIINSFTVDPDKFNSIARFLELLQKEFISPKGHGLFAGKDKNYFKDIGADLVAMDSELGDRDFSETSKVIRHLERFINSLNRVSAVNVDGMKQKFIDIFKAINDAIVGDGTAENKGIQDFTDKFEPVKTVLDTLQLYSDKGLQNLVPGIISGISTAINDFTYDDSKLQQLTFAIKSIAESLGLINGDFGFDTKVKGGLKGSTNGTDGQRQPARRKPKSKTEELARKIEQEKAMEEGIYDISPNAFNYIAQAIAKAISTNSKETQESIRVITEDMLAVFEMFYDRFMEIGMNFMKEIAQGIRVGSVEALEVSATVATGLLSMFDKTIEESDNSGEKFVQSIVQGLTSEDSLTSVQNAINALFHPEEGDGLGMFDKLSDTISTLGDDFDIVEMANSISKNSGEAIAVLSEPISAINDVLSGAVPDGYGLANAMIDGIINALQDRVIEACEQMGQFASMIAGAAAAALGIHSPSKVFYGFGENVVEGFNNAIDDGSKSSRKAVNGLFSYSEKDLKSLRKFLDAYGEVTFKGQRYTRNDLGRINKQIHKLEEERKKREAEEAARKKAEREQEEADKLAAKKAGGGGGAKEAVKEEGGVLSEVKKWVVNGVEMTKEQLKEAYEHVTTGGITSYMGKIFDSSDLSEIGAAIGEDFASGIKGAIPENPVITPVLDDSKIKGGLELPVDVNFGGTSRKMVGRISKKLKKEDEGPDLEALRAEKGNTFNLNQYNYSPKALPRGEIYRQTKNQFAQMRNMIN